MIPVRRKVGEGPVRKYHESGIQSLESSSKGTGNRRSGWLFEKIRKIRVKLQ